MRAGSINAEEIIPRVETERLVLRAWRNDDLDPYAVLSADPEVMRFVGGVRDREQTWRGIAAYVGHWALRGFGLWAVERRADGTFLGRVGLWYPEGWPAEEVGWTLAREAWGHGFATEAAAAAIAWAWAETDLARLISLIDPANARSLAVARRLGMGAIRPGELRGAPVLIPSVSRPQ